MKLLFDQNLSFKLCNILGAIFPESSQVRLLGLEEADDLTVWKYAKDHGFSVVSKDSDFAEISALYGPPPKLVWLRCGNQPTSSIAMRLSAHAQDIRDFEKDDAASFEIY